MQLKIAARLQPFSHDPGISCLVPQTSYTIQFFPCLMRISQFKAQQPIPEFITDIELHIQGPVEQWTVCQDLEKKRVSVWGLAKEGWFRYHLSQALILTIEKAPVAGLKISYNQQTVILQAKESLPLLSDSLFEPSVLTLDRLALGSHRLQNWATIKRRLDLTEILPIWHRLGQLVPVLDASLSSDDLGMLALLKACEKNLVNGKPEEGKLHWLNLFRAGFEGLLVPRFVDHEHQGLIKSASLPALSPLVLLIEGMQIIRRLFVQSDHQTVFVLPHLLPEFHAGRLLDVSLENLGQLSLEWTKKTIRRLIFYSSCEQSLTFQFNSNVRSYRLRQQLGHKGERLACGQSFLFEKNHYYFFDNFE
jgi:hypothetical protein